MFKKVCRRQYIDNREREPVRQTSRIETSTIQITKNPQLYIILVKSNCGGTVNLKKLCNVNEVIGDIMAHRIILDCSAKAGSINPVFDVLGNKGYKPALTHLGNNVWIYGGTLDNETVSEIEGINVVRKVGNY
jgi:hypothetical protein